MVLEVSGDGALSTIVAVPQEVADATFQADTGEDVGRVEVIGDGAQPVVIEHGVSEVVQSLTP